MGQIVHFESGAFLERSEYKGDGGFPVYGANGIIGYTSRILFSEPRIIVGRVGSCGAVNKSASQCWITDNTIVCNPSGEIEYEYLFYFLKSANLSGLRSASIQPLLTQKALQHISIPLPPLSEQKRIVAILNEQMAAVEKARASAEAQLEAAKALPAAYLREVFPKGEPGKAPLPEGWRWARLTEMTHQIRNGTTACQVQGDGIPVSRIETISTGIIDPHRVGRLEGSRSDYSSYALNVGDILFSHINSVERLGNCAMYDGEPEHLIHGMNLLRIESNRNLVVPRYLLHYLRSERAISFFRSNARRAIGQASLNTRDLSSFELPLPSLPEQKSIVAILTDKMKAASELIESVEFQISYINALPAALLRQAFSGAL